MDSEAHFAALRHSIVGVLCDGIRRADDVFVLDGHGRSDTDRLLAQHEDSVAAVCIERAQEMASELIPLQVTPSPWTDGTPIGAYVEACVANATNRALLLCVTRDIAVFQATRLGALRARLVRRQRYALRPR